MDRLVLKGKKRRKGEEKEKLRGGKGKIIYSRRRKEDRKGNGQTRMKRGKNKRRKSKEKRKTERRKGEKYIWQRT